MAQACLFVEALSVGYFFENNCFKLAILAVYIQPTSQSSIFVYNCKPSQLTFLGLLYFRTLVPPLPAAAVSYTHLTLPTILLV